MTLRKKKITGAFLGTIVEYYDYSLYGFSAAILAKQFFPESDHLSGLMYVFAVYAVSYWAKPMGSIFFSKLGDKYGRKHTLRITMIGIAIPTLIIGLLPSYESAGIISTYALVFCRFFQGFFVAGEYDGAAIYVIEHIGKKYHYTASAITRCTGVLGLLFGIATTNFFNSAIFPEWCWRIPFLLSLPLALITMYYRSFLEETPIFVEAQNSQMKFYGLNSFIKRQWRILICIILLAGSFGVTYQISIIFMKQYLPLVLEETSATIKTFSIVAVLGFGASMPIAGLCADYYGKDTVFRTSLLMTLVSLLSLGLAIHFQFVNLALISCLFTAISVAPFNCLAHGVIIKAFKSKERYRGVGLGHTTGSLLMSGTANYVCLLVMREYNIMFFPLFYVAAFACLAYAMVRIISKHNEGGA